MNKTLKATTKPNWEHSKHYLIINESVYLEVQHQKNSRVTECYRGHYLKSVFTEEEMKQFQVTLLSCQETHWDSSVDKKRGERAFMFCGGWTQQGHYTFHPAGKGGHYKVEVEKVLNSVLTSIGKQLSGLVEKYHPDVWNCLEKHKLINVEGQFGMFHLFMCPAESAKMHYDQNDFFSVLVMIHIGKHQVGGLEIGGLDIAFGFQIGDVLLLNTDQLCHGTRGYYGEEDPSSPFEDDRMVGLFIIHHSYLRACKIPKREMVRETMESRTIPKKAKKFEKKKAVKNK